MESMEFETLTVRAEGQVGYLILDRPERLNAMNAAMLRELSYVAQWFNDQHHVRVVIIHGAGNAFSAGADLKDPPLAAAAPGSGLSWGHRREIGQLGLRMVEAVEGMRAVTIAQIHGRAVGGGVVLMTACDLRIVADDATLSIPEVDLGAPLAWGGIPRLVREIGPAMTKELVMTAREFSATEAKLVGLVNRVVKSSKLVAEGEHMATTLSRKPTVPVAITKDHVNAVTRSMAAETAFADGDALLGVMQDPEAQAAMRDYAERTFKDASEEGEGR